MHHKTYDNIGKENLLTELVGLCDRCHANVHQLRNTCRANDPQGQEYWDKFKAYVEENGNQLQLFPKPDLPSIYGIQINQKTLNSADIRTESAVWLVAYRNANELQAYLCMQSPAHYNSLKNIKEQLEGDLGELKWDDGKRWIGFFDNTVGPVSRANTDQEFSWLHDKLIRLHKVFQPHVLEL